MITMPWARAFGLARLEHGDLAGHVEVVGAGRETRGDHGRARRRERPGGVQHQGDAAKA
jgi:hypothetical protein